MATLLLADDSSSMARTVELAFAREDVRVAAVLSGARALAAIEADPPAIVLADIGMAQVNGYDIASYIKHSPSLAHIPVLLLTGPFDRIDEDKARATGCDGIVVKPLEPRLLVEIVRGLLSGGPVDASLLWPADLPRVESWESASNPVASATSPDDFDALEETARNKETVFGWKASRKGLAEPSAQVFDSGLDQLDAAFANGGAPPPFLNEAAAAEFESDLTVLRGRFHGEARSTEAPATHNWIPEPPDVNKTASPLVKIRMKFGSVEFQAEGPAELVQAQLEEFKRMAGTGSTATLRDAGSLSQGSKHRVAHMRKTGDSRH